ncbi:MAG: c-type cytochrome domain-containing protein [Rhodothermales bacterium]
MHTEKLSYRVRFRQWLLATVVLSGFWLIPGCELLGDDVPLVEEPTGVLTYETHIQPLFDRKCVACHSGDAAAGLDLSSWDHLIQGSNLGEALVPFRPDKSVMVRLATSYDRDPHPSGSSRLTEKEVLRLSDWIETGARGPSGAVPFANSANRLYVTHASAPVITVVESEKAVIIARLQLTDYGFTSRARARHVAVEPDGSFWYASISSTRWNEREVVAKFNRSNDLVAMVPIMDPGQLLVHPTRDELYVSAAPAIDEDRIFHRTPTDRREIIRLRRSDLFLTQLGVTYRDAYPLAARPQGDAIFSSSMEVDQMVILEPVSADVTFTPVLGTKHLFRHLSISSDGDWMWGSGYWSNSATLFDISDPNDIVQRQSLWMGFDPRQIVWGPDDALIYVAVRGADAVQVISATLGSVDYQIAHPAMQQPVGVALSPDDSTLYVTAENSGAVWRGYHQFPEDPAPGLILVIDRETRQISKILESATGASDLSGR